MKYKLLFAPVIVALFINLAPISVNAGLFDNLIKDLQKNIPNTGSDAAKVKSQKKFQKGNVDYSSSSIIGFLCQKSSVLYFYLSSAFYHIHNPLMALPYTMLKVRIQHI